MINAARVATEGRPSLRVGFVAPRYGEDIVGGAEQALRSLAEHLAAHRPAVDADGPVEVEVFTTCATEATTWTDDRSPGRSLEGGVFVTRLPSASGRHAEFDRRSGAMFSGGGRTDAAEQAWIAAQGPVCPAVMDAVAAFAPDVVVTCPYLYWPTIEAVRRFGNKVVVHPAAHDEPPFRLRIVGRTLAGSGGLVFFSEAERAETTATHRVAAVRQLVLGLGIDPPPPVPAGVGRGPQRPYLLYLGRVDAGKGTEELVDAYDAWRRARPHSQLELRIAGPVVHPPRAVPGVHVLGPVDVTTKWELLRGAAALVQPSVHESYSIVLHEALAVATPVLVNGTCAATTEAVMRTRGGLTFVDEVSFILAVDRLCGPASGAGGSHGYDTLGQRLGRSGQADVRARLDWERVITHYVRFLGETARRCGGSRDPSGAPARQDPSVSSPAVR